MNLQHMCCVIPLPTLHHQDWSVRYEQDTPVQPRYEINAPDLYIPLMAVVTYILVAGLCLGIQKR